MSKKIKSPLRYPGGKSRAVELFRTLIPDNTPSLCAPFFGGGSIEIDVCTRGATVHGYDVFLPLVEFWQCLLEDKETLVEEVQKHLPLTRDEFYLLQKNQSTLSTKIERAAAFFVLNRASFSGSTLSGGMSPNHPRFTQSSIDRLKNFSLTNMTVSHMSFHDSIPLHKNSLLYLDPPYLIKNNLYGKKGDTHKDFDHEGLRDLLIGRDNWILSYNNCPEILDMYKGYPTLIPTWMYGMSKDKESKEIIIFSKDYPIPDRVK